MLPVTDAKYASIASDVIVASVAIVTIAASVASDASVASVAIVESDAGCE